jgi:hypothetical protein
VSERTVVKKRLKSSGDSNQSGRQPFAVAKFLARPSPVMTWLLNLMYMSLRRETKLVGIPKL